MANRQKLTPEPGDNVLLVNSNLGLVAIDRGADISEGDRVLLFRAKDGTVYARRSSTVEVGDEVLLYLQDDKSLSFRNALINGEPIGDIIGGHILGGHGVNIGSGGSSSATSSIVTVSNGYGNVTMCSVEITHKMSSGSIFGAQQLANNEVLSAAILIENPEGNYWLSGSGSADDDSMHIGCPSSGIVGTKWLKDGMDDANKWKEWCLTIKGWLRLPDAGNPGMNIPIVNEHECLKWYGIDGSIGFPLPSLYITINIEAFWKPFPYGNPLDNKISDINLVHE